MKLFEKNDVRAYDLLLILLRERDNPDLTIAFLSKELNTDRRIIQKYLQRLIDDNLHINSPEKLDLHISSQGIIRLSIPMSFDKNAFKALYYERSISFKLMIDILMGRFISIEDFAEKNFISIPSVYRKFPHLREQLQVLQVDLDLKSEKKFVGHERQIRLFYFYLLQDVQNYLDIPDLLTVDGEKRYDPFTNLLLTITHFRLTSKNYIDETDELDAVKSFATKEASFNEHGKDDLKKFFSVFHLDETTLSAEKHSLYIILNSAMGLSSSRKVLSEATAPRHIDQIDTTIEKVTYAWVQLFIDFFQLTVTKEDFNYLYQVILHGHSTSYIFDRNVQWIHRMDDYELVILDNQKLGEKIDDFFVIVQNNLHFQSFSKNDFTVTLALGYTFYIHSFLTDLNQPVQLHVFSRLGTLATSYIQEKVAKFSMVPVAFVEDETEADLLISDTYNPFSINTPMLHVQPLPQDHELLHIKTAIEKKYYENMLKN